MSDFRTPPSHEPGPQPDPMLEPEHRSSGWLWAAAVAIAIVIVGTLYAVNAPEPQTAANTSASQAAGPGATTQPPASGGRGTADAPKEQQAQGSNQDTGQNPAAGTQGNPNATTGQGNQSDQGNGQPQQ